MKKQDDTITIAREALRGLETDLSTAQGKVSTARQSREKAESDLTAARTRLIEAQRAVEDVLSGIVGDTVPAENLKAARTAVRGIQGEIEDLEAVVKAHGPVELRMKAGVDDLRQRLTTSTKEFWAAVAAELEEKTRKAIGDLLRQALAARELAGWYVSHDTGDLLARLFFARSAPKLEKQRGELLEKYLQ